MQSSTFHLDYFIFGTNSVCAFALNLAIFLLIGKTSALNVVGVVKDWLLIFFNMPLPSMPRLNKVIQL
jgi:hypothetical protein